MGEHKDLSGLPKGWGVAIVEELADVGTGATPLRSNSAYFNGGNIAWVTSGALNDTYVNQADEFITPLALKETNAKVFPKGTLLVAMYGEGKTRGKVSELRIDAATNQACAALHFNGSSSSVKPYVKLFFLKNYEDIRRLSSGGVQPNLNLSIIKKTSVPFPPLPEQQRIVTKIEELFTRLDAGIQSLKDAKKQIKSYRKSVLKAAVEGELTKAWREKHKDELEPASVLLRRILKERREKWEADQMVKMQASGKLPKDDGWKGKYQEPSSPETSSLPKLPSRWIWTTVEQIGIVGEQAVLTGPFGTSLGSEDFIADGIPVLTIGCLTNSGISLDKALFVSEDKAKQLERYRLRVGDLLFSRMASVGRAGVVGENLNGALINYHIMRLRLAENSLLAGFYLAYVRGSKYVSDYLKEVNHGATRDGINTEQLLGMPVVFPPFQEQQKIVAEVERHLSVTDKIEIEIEADLKRAERLRQSILKRAFEGKLVPQNPDDEPAEKLLERIKAERAQREAKGSNGKRRVPKGKRVK